MNLQHPDTFQSASTFRSGEKTASLFRLGSLTNQDIKIDKLPFSLRLLLENLLRNEDGRTVTADDIRFLAAWDPKAEPSREIAFTPARVLMQDFTGIPAVVDLAAMRDAMTSLGGDPMRINPLYPAQLVIDHSVQVDAFGTKDAYEFNTALDFQRNRERYSFLKWGQAQFDNFSVVPSGMGICHQVNLEYLASVVATKIDASGNIVAYPDTVAGTDSHTTMINGLGVLGWGVGGIEAEAAMLGQPISMLVPQVVGFRLSGKIREGVTATDIVLTITQMLRAHGVVGKFVEFYGPSIGELPVADRSTIANMAPEYGATCGLFPVDAETLRYLRMSGRSEEHIAFVEAYYREQDLFHTANSTEAEYSSTLSLDLVTVESSVAGPKRPQDRVTLSDTATAFQSQLPALLGPNANAGAVRQVVRWESEGGHASRGGEPSSSEGESASVVDTTKLSIQQRFGIDPEPYLHHGSIVIAAITSCTSTSNPYLMLGAGLLAKKAVQRGLQVPPWVKTSLAPGSRVVTDYYVKSGLLPYLEALRFHIVGYGCTMCIGNSGPLPSDVSNAIDEHALVAVSVLSGNRNFEGRISPEVRANYLMSPPLVVAYALAGTILHNFDTDALGRDTDGTPVYLRDVWPTQAEIADAVSSSIDSEMFRTQYATIADGDHNWQQLAYPSGSTYAWEDESTYIRKPPYFDGMLAAVSPVQDILGARVLAMLGDSITTDHISPAGSIKLASPAGHYLTEHGVKPEQFNTYGSRRGNHEVMVRGTFANVRLRNQLTPGLEGGVTLLLPDNTPTTIYEASEIYAQRGTPLAILAGKEYGSGSSRDWAAKGPRLLGVRFVIAESYERIHRSNLVGMGILPLQFLPGQSASSLSLTGRETYSIGTRAGELATILKTMSNGATIEVTADDEHGSKIQFRAAIRIDTPKEVLYYQHGGILPYVLRELATNQPG